MFDWMASNVTSREDGRGNIYPRKPHGQEHLKIDGITAVLMAEGLSMEDHDNSVDNWLAGLAA
jgi:phage terminase large subunit-like protein